MEFQPLADLLVVDPVTPETQTNSGLFIPDAAQENPVEGTVLAAGIGRRDAKGNLIPMQVKVGDHVIFGTSATQDIKLGDEEYLVISETNIIGIVTK